MSGPAVPLESFAIRCYRSSRLYRGLLCADRQSKFPTDMVDWSISWCLSVFEYRAGDLVLLPWLAFGDRVTKRARVDSLS